jgi:hypothetical protein
MCLSPSHNRIIELPINLWLSSLSLHHLCNCKIHFSQIWWCLSSSHKVWKVPFTSYLSFTNIFIYNLINYYETREDYLCLDFHLTPLLFDFIQFLIDKYIFKLLVSLMFTSLILCSRFFEVLLVKMENFFWFS